LPSERCASLTKQDSPSGRPVATFFAVLRRFYRYRRVELLTTFWEYGNNGAGTGAGSTPAANSDSPTHRGGIPQGRMEWISRRTISKTTTSCRGWKKTTSWAAAKRA